MRARPLFWVASAGGVGGMVNAALCYADWPVPVQDAGATSHWHVVPAGLVHGALLALSAAVAGPRTRRHAWPFRIATCSIVGWIGGYLSWIPLDMSAFGSTLPAALAWPFTSGDSWLDALWIPFPYFGLVADLLCLWLTFAPERLRTAGQVPAAVVAGIGGSLWWWIAWGPWYFSVLHGLMWGVATGSALALSPAVRQDPAAALTPSAARSSGSPPSRARRG